jgi:hypothetical protein
MMLGLYLYGYLHRVRSSRRLRDEAKRNVEVMWLMCGLTPDDKTVSNFRQDNAKALRETFRVFVGMCRALGLYGGEVIAVDGPRIRAANSLKNHWTATVVGNELERTDKKINEYMKLLEESDREEAGETEPGVCEIRAALEKLREKKVTYEGLQSRLAAEKEISSVDPDARMVRTGGDGRELDVGYNVQTVADGKYHMLVDFEVTDNSGDAGNLHKMSVKAKEALEVEEITVLADKGYYSGEDIAACEGDGVTCLVAKRKPGGSVKSKGFSRGNFIYDKNKDIYTCPAGNPMKLMRVGKKNGGKEYRIYANYEACGKCPEKSECTKYAYREMWRLPCQDTVDEVDERTRKNKELYRERGEIIEHVFGTVKSVWGYRQYLCRTVPKVTAETALAYLAYNMRRVVNIFKKSKLIPVFG